MPLVEVQAGRRLNVVRRGSGPPLLLVMGMSGNVLHWTEPFLQLLQEHFDVVAFDHRGAGWSERVTDPFTIRDLADDAARVLDAVGLDRAHVLGISMGGMVAQELALEHAGRVDRLVLGCTYSGGEGSALTEEVVWQRLAEGMMSGDRDKAMDAFFWANVSDAYASDAAHFDEFRRVALMKPTATPVIMLQAQAIQSHDTSARLERITAPTLVVHGDEDRMLPVANGRLIASRIPGAQLEVLEGAGHMFWVERPEEVDALVRAHLLGAG
ncbi:alpha/beta fold hydrolase [Conexibacter sp. SYSU D00693]|uniref:alpha/beta fold hydrolase n=1 Tax=Conexibacter sp. SYSU D00693 TaxID=2812560 RepID=UPI00196B9DEC|nr:alpha/beta fold hydrolase [Conexibacter sp. SYSU D00693]